MPNGNLFPRLRRSVEELVYVIVEADLALFDQEHNPGRDELFADGTNLEDGLRSGWNIELDIRHTVTLGLDNLPIFDYCKGQTRNVLRPHLGSNVVVYRFRTHRDRGGEQENN